MIPLIAHFIGFFGGGGNISLNGNSPLPFALLLPFLCFLPHLLPEGAPATGAAPPSSELNAMVRGVAGLFMPPVVPGVSGMRTISH